MDVLKRYAPFFSSALLMCIVLVIIFPHYRYYIDPDGTAYLTISQRYANGDYLAAINGYWSPWSCWLTALLIKTGVAAITASWAVNALGATGFLFISQSFFLRFHIIPRLQWIFEITLSFFLCYAVFWQSFDDLWECFFLLSGLRLLLSKDYAFRPMLWVLTGITGALAYFAKAYAFPFFALSTLCCVYFLCDGKKVQWLKISLVSIFTMILCSLPWIVALHYKYGIWTTATSGSLNMSWYLVGHPQWKEGIDLLIPPPYNNSPDYWEDPYMANGPAPHFWDSFHLLGLQFVRSALNVLKLVKSMLQISVFFPVVAVILARFVASRKAGSMRSPEFIVALSFLLFPAGYLLINFETRYIWYMLPLCLLAGGLFYQNHLSGAGKKYLNLFPWVFAVSFLIGPVWRMSEMYDEGISEFKISQRLKSMNIRGFFTSDAKPGIDVQRIKRLAYFSGNSYYSVTSHARSQLGLLREMRRYHVKYYISYGADTGNSFRDEQDNFFPEVTAGAIKGLKVWLVNP
jgi:hypothetical protein